MKLSYDVFHLENSSNERNGYTQQIHNKVSRNFYRLNCGTINFMNGEEHYKDFLISNPGFKPIGEMKIGWIGVWASNYNAWKKLLDSEYDAVMLFEDDCIIDDNGALAIYQYMQELPEGWDFFSPFVHTDQYDNYHNNHDIQSENVCKSYQDWSLACYIVSKGGAEKAVNYVDSHGFEEPVDYFVFNKNTDKFNSYTLKPTVRKYVNLAELPTTIQDVETRITLNGSI